MARKNFYRRIGAGGKTAAAFLAVSLFILASLTAGGCSHRPASGPQEQDVAAESTAAGGSPQGQGTTDSSGEESGGGTGGGEKPGDASGESRPDASGEPAAPTDSGETGEEGDNLPEGVSVQQRVVIATDLHYLAERLAGNRCQSFMAMAESGDGCVLPYSWEVLDAFIDDMLELEPDLIVLSGDLTLNGERESHEELAGKLEVLLEHDIPVIVIPGNHDINNPYAVGYSQDGTERVESIDAEEFASIYADCGYVAADSRDPASLSYAYHLDDYYRLVLLDSCQYEPYNQVGGMIRSETYDWLEQELSGAWEEGAQVLTVSHHNLLDQSGVSREFYDNCTIEHNEVLVRLLEDQEVRLHLSGHLHLQHYMQDEDSGISEVITGSLLMAPCYYGDIRILDDGTIRYDARTVDVNGWAVRNSYRNPDLADFKSFSENFLRRAAYGNAIADLRRHVLDRKIFVSDEMMDDMARFYAKLCVYYYGGRMYEIAGEVESEAAFENWSQINYVSDLSDFLHNILDDDAKDFRHLEIPY